MKLLALNPFHGGSHAALLDGWARHSRHAIDPLTLPARHWKWRLRHAAITFADQLTLRLARGGRWDVLWCTDMLDLATFQALAPAEVGRLPAVVYFHENQLTYPTREQARPDLQPAFTNFTTALAADAVWFNSDFHRRAFLDGLRDWLVTMPDHRPTAAVDRVEAKATVQHPGVDLAADPPPDPPAGPLRIVWAARWEHDKNPELFFDALGLLVERGVDFEVSVIGEAYADRPGCFDDARRRLAGRVRRWGYQPDRVSYARALGEAHVFVSTAVHEFFGIAAVEAAAHRCLCVLPHDLAYPEVFGEAGAVWHDGTPTGLADRLAELAGRTERDEPRAAGVAPAIDRFAWPRRASAMDAAIDRLADASDPPRTRP